MSARRASWPMVGPGVLVDAVTAPAMLALLADGRRRAEREGWMLAEETVTIIQALEALAADARRMAPEPPTGEPDWITTAEAGDLLAVSTRQVRRMTEPGTLMSE